MMNRCLAALLCTVLFFGTVLMAQSSSNPLAQSSMLGAEDCATQPNASGCERQQQQQGYSQGYPQGGVERYPGSFGGNTAQPTPGTIIYDDSLATGYGSMPAGQYGTNVATPRQTPLPPEPASEFQEFVASSLGNKLPVFGRNLFSNVPSTFAQVDRVPVTADYVIGPGDQLIIRAWGQINITARVAVDRGGEIFLPKIGAISVAGVKYEQLPAYLKTVVGRDFRNFDLTVTLGQLRSIQIFVLGYARRPGVYTVSSLSTLINALFASGGPSSRGSMRHIQLKRNNQIVSDFDLYDLLIRGDKSKDMMLMPGDIIYIPPVGPQVAIAGSVNFPAIYELHSKVPLGEEIETAGGLTSVADGGRVIVERVDEHANRNVEEFNLDDGGVKRELKDGDLVRVFSISPKFGNAITIRGSVAEPGRYPWHEGMRVRDLIPNREFLITRQFWLRQSEINGNRGLNSNWRADGLGSDGRAQSSSKQDPSLESTPGGELQEIATADEGKLQLRTHAGGGGELQANFHNDLKQNAPEINWDYAVIQRINPQDLTTELIPFDLGKAVSEGGDRDNVLLRPGDVVTIFSQHDMAVGLERQTKFLRLEGEFRAPGIYRVQPGETLRSLIERAGGLNENAYVFGTQFTRESSRAEQQKSLDRMVQDMDMEVERLALSPSGAGSTSQDVLRARVESQRAVVASFKAVKATGRVVLEIKPSQSGVGSFPEIALEDGDRILVPHKPDTVSVLGAVYNANSFLFKPGKRVEDYLKLAGSGTRESDMKHNFLIRADGSVLSDRTNSGVWSGGLSSIRMLPGDTIIVPARLNKGAFMLGLKDWTQIFSQFGLGAAAINVLR